MFLTSTSTLPADGDGGVTDSSMLEVKKATSIAVPDSVKEIVDWMRKCFPRKVIPVPPAIGPRDGAIPRRSGSAKYWNGTRFPSRSTPICTRSASACCGTVQVSAFADMKTALTCPMPSKKQCMPVCKFRPYTDSTLPPSTVARSTESENSKAVPIVAPIVRDTNSNIQRSNARKGTQYGVGAPPDCRHSVLTTKTAMEIGGVNKVRARDSDVSQSFQRARGRKNFNNGSLRVVREPFASQPRLLMLENSEGNIPCGVCWRNANEGCGRKMFADGH
eukprot:3213754-Rhodomonas_salina.2